MSQTSFRIIGRNFKKSEDRSELAKELQSAPHTYRYLGHTHFLLSTNSLPNTSQTQLTPTISANEAAAIMLWPLNQNGSGSTLYTPLQLLSWNVVDGGSNSLTGIPYQLGYIEDTFSRYCMNDNLDTLAMNSLYFYLFSWADQLQLSLRKGVNSGSIYFDPSYRCVVQPAASQAYQMNICVWQYQTFTVNGNGGVVVER